MYVERRGRLGVARIMICDDSSFMRMLLKKILINKGHEIVGEAGNGKQAAELYQKLRPDVTTMDITMPEVDGLAGLKLIRAEDSKAKVVMVSAIGQRAVIIEAIQSGASDFLVKPFENEQVIMVVNNILRL
ncbi:MAG: response regulator receiver protein [Firmicutes bacterium]|nr:response regulator receiver protein [Bacillota bacterium]